MQNHEIQVGQCYETLTGQFRFVLKIERNCVTYEEQSKTDSGGTSRQTATVSLENFASRVKCQIAPGVNRRDTGWT